MRLTNRIRNHVEVEDVTKANNKLADLEDLMENYGIETIEELEEIIKSHNTLALTFGGRVFKRKGE